MNNEEKCSKCYEFCQQNKLECTKQECRYWIDWKDDKNCTFIAIQNNGGMTLREIGERLKISIVEVGKIEKKFLARMRKFFFKNKEYQVLKDYL